MTSVPYGRRLGHRHRGKTLWEHSQRQSQRERRQKPTLLTPWCWTSSLLNHETNLSRPGVLCYGSSSKRTRGVKNCKGNLGLHDIMEKQVIQKWPGSWSNVRSQPTYCMNPNRWINHAKSVSLPLTWKRLILTSTPGLHENTREMKRHEKTHHVLGTSRILIPPMLCSYSSR